MKSAEGGIYDRFASIHHRRDPSHSIVERARYEPVLSSSCHLYSGGLVDNHCIWASASNNKRVEHCWKMGRTRRHLPMYRTRMYGHVAVCVREMQTVCIIPCHPILRELSEPWHVAERMNACRNRHSFQLGMGEEDARIIGHLCLYKRVYIWDADNIGEIIFNMFVIII